MKKWLLLTGVLFSFTLSACAINREPVEENQNPQQLIKVKNSVPEHVQNRSAQEISRHLVQLATNIPNVNDATAVVVGKYAIVGIDVDAKLERSEVGSIKYSVAESLKEDPFGANAIVIADPDTYARLREIGRDIQNGRPITGFLEELADIAGRVVPEAAEDIRRNPSGTQTNDDNLPSDKQKELKQEQQDQSKNNLNK
ncbi:YhcN/YlaJ family sporulation lipoprotein [Bacillus songklensis]|uniref:YhcN/YlaJ family sporulation lipoprotein n=1 Tax=Bacillus songklensis TaxID=1069116 RepID=A0ABV8B4L4_9BACI